ncbi:MAG: hypothetical protein QXS20_05835 [Candidatus Thorarchaeota archaeon]
MVWHRVFQDGLEAVRTEVPADESKLAPAGDLISLLRPSSSRPIRLLVIDTYDGLEYTGRTHITDGGVELREAILVP